jgi:hypothetical protein
VKEFGVPLRGVWDSLGKWVHGHEVFAAGTIIGCVVLAVYGLRRRGMASPWAWAVLVELAFTAMLGVDVIGLNFNGTRTTMPLQVAVLLLVATPAVSRSASTFRRHRDSLAS